MTRHVRVLLLSALPGDEQLAGDVLHRHGYEVEFVHAADRVGLEEAIGRSDCDVILADIDLPGLDGFEALDVYHAQNVDLPFILLADSINAEKAIVVMKAGAHDFIQREDMARLGPAVERELREARVRRDRQRAFRALRRSEERFRAAVERSRFAFFIFESVRDETGRIVDFIINYANPRGLDMIERPRAEVLNGRLSEKLPGMASGPMMKELAEVAETGNSFDGEGPTVEGELKPRYVHYLAVPLGDGVALTMADISDRWRSQQELKHFFNLPLALLCVMDEQGRIIRANPAWKELLGWSPDSLCGQCYSTLIHPDELPRVEAIIDSLKAGTHAEPYDTRVRCRDGSYRSIVWKSAWVSGRWYHVGQDVTEIREVGRALAEGEARYRAIVEDQTELICRYLPDGRISFVNESLARHWKDSPSALLGRNRFDMVPQAQGMELRNLHTQMIEDGLDSGQIELELPDGPDRTRWERWRVRALRDSAGRISEFQAVGSDITQRREAHQEQARMDERLRHIQKMEALGTLASGVAHDFSNLLTVIFGYTDLASRLLPQGHPAQNYLKTIEKVATRATGVTNSLLTFSQRKASEKRPVNLNELANESSRLLRRVIPRSIDMCESIDPEAVWVEGDETQLQQVIMNLALNARDAMPDGGRLELIVRRVPCDIADESRSAGQAVLEIIDNGCGMEKAVLDRIFEPFFSTKERGQGTGLGLSIAHSIIGDHGGQIEVQSTVNVGTRFTVTLPAVEMELARIQHVEEEEKMVGAGESVLIVEDDAFVRSIIVSALDEEGYCTIEAEDGQIAIERVMGNLSQISLVILDLDLPRVHGLVVLERIRQLRPELPVLVITGNPDNERINGHVDAVTHLVRKPFQISQLLKLIMRILRGAERNEVRV
ncbi:MAG: response regulator [Phycisphaeraceae bacterium]|nr:response regulator [Phycisphaeraceae bacterium]